MAWLKFSVFLYKVKCTFFVPYHFIYLCSIDVLCTVLVLGMALRIWKETKQHPGTAGPDNMLDCCLVSFHFLLAILSTSNVDHNSEIQGTLSCPPTRMLLNREKEEHLLCSWR